MVLNVYSEVLQHCCSRKCSWFKLPTFACGICSIQDSTRVNILLDDHLSDSPVNADQIRECTRKDSLLALVGQFVQQGWPSSCLATNLLSFYEVHHITLNPISSSLLAEHAVQLVKQKTTRSSMKNHLTHIMFHYHLTPHITTGVSSSELLLRWYSRSRLDLLKPHTAEQVEKKQMNHSRNSSMMLDAVFIRNYHQLVTWYYWAED